MWCEEGVEVVKGHFVVFKDCKHQSEPQQGELSSYELSLPLSQLSPCLISLEITPNYMNTDASSVTLMGYSPSYKKISSMKYRQQVTSY